MKIEQVDEIKKGFFQALENEKIAGKVEYTWAGRSKFIIDHTEVDPDFKGQGIGKKLIKATVDFAKENYKEDKTKLFKAIPAIQID